MFGLLKKSKDEVIHNEVLGDLTYHTTWHGNLKITFDRAEYDIDVCISEDDEDKYRFVNHEKAYSYYIMDREIINSKIISVLKGHYNLDNKFKITDRFCPVTLILFQNGECGMVFTDSEEGTGSSAAQTVVEILPEISFLVQ